MSASPCARALAQTLVPSLLLLATVVLVGMTRSDGMQAPLDLVSVFSYTKAPVDAPAALRNNTRDSPAGVWHGDLADAAHCLDMSYFNFPLVKFVPGADPTTPTCQIGFTLALVGQDIRVTPLFSQEALSCRFGIYPLQVSGGSSGMPSSSLNLQIGGNANGTGIAMSVVGSVSGGAGGFAFNNGKAWAACRARREELAQQYLNNTSCLGDYSPMCTCVRAFTQKLTNLNRKLLARPAPDKSLEDVLHDGVEQCIALRRAHDVRREAGPKYARSKALLTFVLALFFNSVLHCVVDLSPSITMWLHVVWLSVFFVSTLLAGLLSGGQAEFQTVLSVLLPAFALHGGYDFLVDHVLLFQKTTPRPHLHPVVFDLCLCSLSLFTLVERGVVQSEHLLAEIFKCHGIALVYMALVWYHRHMSVTEGTARTVFSAPPVYQGYALLVVVALAAAADSLLVPYATKVPFELHWLLPLAFTFLALSNPSWVYALDVQRSRHPSDPSVRLYGPERYNCLANALSLAFGFVFWGYFLRDYIRVYGAAHFPYGTLQDLHLPLLTRGG